MNELKGGFLYNASWFGYNAAPLYATSLGLVNWGIAQSGQNFNLGINTNYPVFNASDSLTWQHDKHTITFGFSCGASRITTITHRPGGPPSTSG